MVFRQARPRGAARARPLVRTVVVTAANVADVTQTAELLRGQEQQVPADAGAPGVEQRPASAAWERKLDWQIARKRGPSKTRAEGAEKAAAQRRKPPEPDLPTAGGRHPLLLRPRQFDPSQPQGRQTLLDSASP